MRTDRSIWGEAMSLVAAWRQPDVFDAARGQPAWQSSYHAGGARDLRPDGSHPNRRFRRTVVEENPWWMVDLQEYRPIHAIRIHKRAAAGAHHAAHLTVSISRDKAHWQIAHAGVHFFGDPGAPGPLEIRLLDQHGGRYVRLELPGEGVLCPDRVEVLVERRHSKARVGGRRRRFIRKLRQWVRGRRVRRDTAWYVPELVNVAMNCPVSQSSMHDDDESYGPAAALAIDSDRRFVATKRELNPWWMIDLQTSHPIHLIRIHHQPGADVLLTARLVVGVSEDASNWERVHAGLHVFGDSRGPGRLEIRLLGSLSARFVRLEVNEVSTLTFRRIEILVERQYIALQALCWRHGFVMPAMVPGRSGWPRYTMENVPRPFDGALGALHVTRLVGRFGNHLKSIQHALCLARRLGVQRVYLPPIGQFDIAAPIEAGGVTLLPERMLVRDAAVAIPGAILSGSFFYREAFGDHLKNIPAQDVAWAMRNFARPLFHRTALSPRIAVEETDLAIHIRSGDLFSNRRPHAGYVQPPLAYYQLIVAHARRSVGIRRVILVYENELNPCIGALKEWLQEISMPVIDQSASLGEDLAVLMQARHCVFGYGTFGTALVRLSEHMRTVFAPWTMTGLPQAARDAGVRPIIVHDTAGAYLRSGTWRGTPEQRRMMVEYPIANLALDESPPQILPACGEFADEADD